MDTDHPKDINSSLDGLKATQSFVLAGTIGGPTRVEILRALGIKSRTINELATKLGQSASTLRKHLEVLVDNDIVEAIEGANHTVFVLAGEGFPSVD